MPCMVEGGSDLTLFVLKNLTIAQCESFLFLHKTDYVWAKKFNANSLLDVVGQVIVVQDPDLLQQQSSRSFTMPLP